MATPKKGNQKNMGLINQPSARNLEKDFPVDEKSLRLSNRKNFKLNNSSANNESIPLEFIASVKSILNLRGKNDRFRISDYGHIAKLILDGKPMLDSREEMLCLAFFEIGLSLGADHTLKSKMKDRSTKARGGSHSKYKKHQGEITKLLKEYIATPVRHQQKVVDLIEELTGETLKKSTFNSWLKKLRDGKPLYKENLLSS
jgi:hypothetical protein